MALGVGVVVLVGILTAKSSPDNTKTADYKKIQPGKDIKALAVGTNFSEYKINEDTKIATEYNEGKTYKIVNYITKVGLDEKQNIKLLIEPARAKSSYKIGEYLTEQGLPTPEDILPGPDENTDIAIYYSKGIGIEYNRYSEYLYSLIAFEPTTKEIFSKEWGKSVSNPGEFSEGVSPERFIE